MNIKGGGGGIIVFENSQVSIAYVQVQDTGYATLAIYDSSDAHVEHCQFVNTASNGWHQGISLGASQVTMYATMIRNMQQAIGAGATSIVDLVVYNTYYVATGNTDVVIDSSAGITFEGVNMVGGSLNIYNAKLVINNSSQSWGATTAAISLDEGANMIAGSGYLSITGQSGTGSRGHEQLAGYSVWRYHLAGNSGRPGRDQQLEHRPIHQQQPSFNDQRKRRRLFCDSGSKITGTANIAGTPSAQCTNLLSSEWGLLP